jgi:hypothetical protein
MKRRKRVARKAAKPSSRSRRRTSVARPQTFEEVRAANLADPFHAARIARLDSGERFDDPNAASNDRWVREVFVHPDCEGGSHWMVDWGDRLLRDDVRRADGGTASARVFRRAQGRTAQDAVGDRMNQLILNARAARRHPRP